MECERSIESDRRHILRDDLDTKASWQWRYSPLNVPGSVYLQPLTEILWSNSISRTALVYLTKLWYGPYKGHEIVNKDVEI